MARRGFAWRDQVVIGHVPHAFQALPHSWSASVEAALPALKHAAQGVLVHFRSGARYISRHTGIPAVFIAAALIVASWRLARKVAHIAVEVCVVAVLLLALTKLGVVSW